jgi:hypothetical protein
LLADLGCDLLQGFLLARPQAAEQLRSSLALDLPFHDGASIVPATADLPKTAPEAATLPSSRRE